MTQHSTSQSHNNGKAPISGGKAIALLLVVVVVAVILAVAGIIPRLKARTTLQQETNALAAPNVFVDYPRQGQPSQEIVLPGNIQAYTDSPIYARTNGYLKKWYFDIGAHVKQGQLLAIIETPEVDKQLAQAKADLATAQANAANAQIQSARYQELLKGNAVSKQDTDNFTTQAAATTTQVQSALANVQRLEQLVGFESVYAPFDGIITARNVDVGTLIDAGADPDGFAVITNYSGRQYLIEEQTSFVRFNDPIEVKPGVMVPKIILADGVAPIFAIPGDSVGSWTLSGHNYTDMFLVHMDSLKWAFLGGAAATILDIPIGTDGKLQHLYIPFMMGALVVEVPQFLGRLSLQTS